MTKGEMEALISSRMIKFQRDQLGRGAESAKTYIIDDNRRLIISIPLD